MAEGQKPITWKKIIARGMHPVLFIDVLCTSSARDLPKILGFDFRFSNWKRYEGATFLDEGEYSKLAALIKEKGPGYIEKLADDYENKNRALIEHSKEISEQEFIGYSNKKINEVLAGFFEEYCECWAYCYIPWVIEDLLTEIIEPAVLEGLKAKGREKLLAEYLAALTISQKETETSREHIALLRIASEIERDGGIMDLFRADVEQIKKELPEAAPSIFHKIEEHSERFKHLTSYVFLVNPYTKENVIEKLMHVMEKGHIAQRLADLEKQESEKKRKFNEILGELGIGSDLLEKINLMQRWSHVRTYRIEASNVQHSYMKLFFEEVAKRMNLNYGELIWLTMVEIMDFLEEGKKPNVAEINARKENYGILMIDGKMQIFTGKDVEKLKEQGSKDHEFVKEFKGMTAFPGIAQGNVKIIKNQYDESAFRKFNAGDVLVSSMTLPGMAILMEKAAAVITDEGGMLSHAAIISRELKKPCIIGTKIATKVLKNGDLVEVDANSGIVRRIG